MLMMMMMVVVLLLMKVIMVIYDLLLNYCCVTYILRIIIWNVLFDFFFKFWKISMIVLFLIL